MKYKEWLNDWLELYEKESVKPRTYVLGDNGDNSYDSRYWSDPFVKRETVIAKLLFH